MPIAVLPAFPMIDGLRDVASELTGHTLTAGSASLMVFVALCVPALIGQAFRSMVAVDAPMTEEQLAAYVAEIKAQKRQRRLEAFAEWEANESHRAAVEAENQREAFFAPLDQSDRSAWALNEDFNAWSAEQEPGNFGINGPLANDYLNLGRGR